MKKDYTHITIVLDRSGSMQAIKTDTIGGFNSFLKDQQAQEGEASLTLVQFDNIYELVCDGLAIKEVPGLTDATFVPRGSTALLDAISRALDSTGSKLAALPEAERPEKVIIVIITDGEENASRHATLASVNDKITLQRDTYKWQFVFLGANQDAISTASAIGVPARGAITYAANSMGVNSVFTSASSNLRAYRGNVVADMAFTDEDKKKQTEAGVKDDK